LSQGGLTTDATGTGSVDNKGKTTITSTVSLKLTFVNAAGSLSGSFVHPVTNKTVTIAGVPFQKTNSAGGFFLSSTAADGLSGSVLVLKQ
jgi:hypothetical protein